MPNLIVFFFNHFLFMYMGLCVRVDCERLVKNQASRVELIPENAMCEAHDWKKKSRVRLSFSRLFHEKGQPTKDS